MAIPDEVYVLGPKTAQLRLGWSVENPDILHIPADDEQGTPWVMVPAFTDRRSMDESVKRNPGWRGLTLLKVDRDLILRHIKKGMMLVIDPWTDHEQRLPFSG